MQAILATIAATAAAGFVAIAPAHAQKVDAKVEVDRSLLETVQGQVEVYASLVAAAEDACASKERKAHIFASVAACTNDMVSELVSDLGHAGIDALHAGGRIR